MHADHLHLDYCLKVDIHILAHLDYLNIKGCYYLFLRMIAAILAKSDWLNGFLIFWKACFVICYFLLLSSSCSFFRCLVNFYIFNFVIGFNCLKIYPKSFENCWMFMINIFLTLVFRKSKDFFNNIICIY